LISFVGLIIGLIYIVGWVEQGFGPLYAFKPAVLSLTLLVLGIQIIFSSFFLSLLGVEKR